MNKVDKKAIEQLIETEDGVCVSLYMPTHKFPTPEHISEDKIRFKNLIKASKELLMREKADDELVARIVDNLEESVYEDSSFWPKVTEGTAVFCTPAGVRYFNLPAECDEYVSTGGSYDIAPLLALDYCNQSYYLLALATKHPVLYYGDMYGLEKIEIDLPESMMAALNIDELHSNSRTIRAGGYGPGGTKAHGQGDTRQAGQEERLKYFRLIDNMILTFKSLNKRLPILLAGTEDDVSAYKDISRNKKLLEKYVSGNNTELPAHDVHVHAWPIITEELCETDTLRELERVHELLGTGLASVEREAVSAAAKEGRVDSLLLGIFLKTMDSVSDSDEEVRKLSLSGEYTSSNIGTIARAVFDHGGKIVGVQGEIMPDGAKIAATYRY